MTYLKGFVPVVIFVLSLLVLTPRLQAGSGIFESYGIFSSVNQVGTSLLNTYYDMQAITANPDFSNNNFGTFDLLNSGNLLQLKGGEIKTYKNNGSDVRSATINYRVYETSVGPGTSFASLNLPFSANLTGPGTNPGDQRWAATGNSVNLLTALSGNKNYTIEVYFSADSTDGTLFSNAGGSNYKAFFSTVPEPSSASLLTFALSGLLALRRRRNA